MNQLFLQSLDKIAINSPKNAALIEAVKKAYINCEQQAQLEGRLGKFLGTAAIAGLGALGALGIEHHNDVADAVQSTSDSIDKHFSIEDDARNIGYVAEQRSFVGDQLLEKGWHRLKYTDKPDLISDTYKSKDMAFPRSIDEIRHQVFNSNYIDCDFIVSPDGTKYYSNLTGMMYETPVDENGKHLDVTDPKVNKDNRGTQIGYGEDAIK